MQPCRSSRSSSGTVAHKRATVLRGILVNDVQPACGSMSGERILWFIGRSFGGVVSEHGVWQSRDMITTRGHSGQQKGCADGPTSPPQLGRCRCASRPATTTRRRTDHARSHTQPRPRRSVVRVTTVIMPASS